MRLAELLPPCAPDLSVDPLRPFAIERHGRTSPAGADHPGQSRSLSPQQIGLIFLASSTFVYRKCAGRPHRGQALGLRFGSLTASPTP